MTLCSELTSRMRWTAALCDVAPCELNITLFNGHSSEQSGSASTRHHHSGIFYLSLGCWRWYRGGDNLSYKTCEAAVKSSSLTNEQPAFYRPVAVPVAQPTMSEH